MKGSGILERAKSESDLDADSGITRIRYEGASRLATPNLIPGNTVYGERLVRKDGTEYRLWDPFRSKLAAAILNGLEEPPIGAGSSVLYLGASTGTTTSHISDIVGGSGVVFGVENASRVARDFIERVASRRPNVIPIVQDAKRPEEYFSVYGKADMVYVDVAQPDQTRIAISNCIAYLRRGGHLLLVIKARSIDSTKNPEVIVNAETEKLLDSFDVCQSVWLEPYDKDHAMISATFRAGPQGA